MFLSPVERVEFVFELWDRRRRALPDHRSTLQFGVDATRLRWIWHAAGIYFFTAIFTPATFCGSADGRRIVAIDPRPCIGDPAMDLTDLAVNGASSKAEIRSRCSQLADLPIRSTPTGCGSGAAASPRSWLSHSPAVLRGPRTSPLYATSPTPAELSLRGRQ